MKTALFATALVFGMNLLNLPISGQQAAAPSNQSGAQTAAPSQADQSTAASAQTARGAASTKISEAAYAYMRPVSCELAGKLDSKTAKLGDPVTAKSKESIRIADGTVIPKGAKLVGHVTEVQAHTSEQAESHLSIAFDRAEWSGGHSLAIHSILEAVSPPVQAFAASSATADDSLAGPMGGSGPRGMGSARGGGVGSTAGSLGSNLGVNASNPGANAGGVMRSASQTAGGVAGDATSTADIGVNAAASSSMGVHATGIPGVMLAGDASGATSGRLSASKHNVHLDAGTQLTLAISAAGPQ